ncbi:MAG: IS66 family insertion sequence element accessory protein TnpB [Candidatus Thiodiazotropha sp. (ex Ustalcina ferruginea)]|nr:IS66 family insertion sequence element accessory protein TnpB [Candidatus Thiodiazotropha sp. (ex Ustalcina ferruginea)]
MIHWQGTFVYLHRDPVDFRKAINGLSLIVEQAMSLSPFEAALFVFCNKRRDLLKFGEIEPIFEQTSSFSLNFPFIRHNSPALSTGPV